MSLLGSELKKQIDIAKKQYKQLGKAYEFDKKEEDETKIIHKKQEDETRKNSVSNEIYSTLLNLLFTNTTDPKAIQQTKSIELLKDPDDATVANKTMFFLTILETIKEMRLKF